MASHGLSIAAIICLDFKPHGFHAAMTKSDERPPGAAKRRCSSLDSFCAERPIPDRLNTLLTLVVVVSAGALLLLASRLERWWQILAVAIIFSYLMLTDCALQHEAAHDKIAFEAKRELLAWFSLRFPPTRTRSTEPHNESVREDEFNRR